MVYIGTIGATKEGTFTVSNLVATDSGVNLFNMENLVSSSNLSQSLTLSNLEYRDSTISRSQNLIRFGGFSSSTDFQIFVTETEFTNITFTQKGVFIKLEQQTVIPIQIFN